MGKTMKVARIKVLKFMFSKKATKNDEIFTIDLTLCSKCQIYGVDFANFCGLLIKYELYEFAPSCAQPKNNHNS